MISTSHVNSTEFKYLTLKSIKNNSNNLISNYPLYWMSSNKKKVWFSLKQQLIKKKSKEKENHQKL